MKKSKTARKEPSGYICPCGVEHQFSIYVFAHWKDRLTHTCDKCDAINIVRNGKVTTFSGTVLKPVFKE